MQSILRDKQGLFTRLKAHIPKLINDVLLVVAINKVAAGLGECFSKGEIQRGFLDGHVRAFCRVRITMLG